jgi:acyl carrier protein
VESGEPLLASVDSLDMLEILASFDEKLGRATDPQKLPKASDDFETIVARLNQIHGMT